MKSVLNGKARITGGIMIGMIALCGTLGLWSGSQQAASFAKMRDVGTLIQAHMEADMMHDAVRADVLAALVARDPASGLSATDASKDLNEHLGALRQGMEADRSYQGSAAVSAAAMGLGRPMDAYAAAARKIMDVARTDPPAAMAELPQFKRQFSQLEVAMAKISNLIAQHAAQVQSSALRQQFLAARLVDASLAILLMLTVGVVIAVSRQLVQPLLALHAAMHRLVEGDLEQPIAESDRADEIGMMARAVAQFRESLIEGRRLQEEVDGDAARAQTRMIGDLNIALRGLAEGKLSDRLVVPFPAEYESLRINFNEAIDRLGSMLGDVETTVGSLRSGSNEIADASNDFARRTEQQAASIEQAAASMAGISTSVTQSAAGIAQVTSSVAAAHKDAACGGEIVREAIAAMDRIEESAREIGQIVSVIDGIAFQTNLLALNAGVEAARAGDAGKGFAVVANEVRALAERSADSARHIASLIAASTSQVQIGVDLVGRTGDSLKRIVDKVGEIRTLAEEIAASSVEQAGGIARVTGVVGSLDHATQQNAAMAEESTAAARSLLDEADRLAELIDTFELTAPARLSRAA